VGNKVFDRVKVTCATTGTGNLTLGPALAGFQTFAEGGAADLDNVAFVIEDAGGFEISWGQLGGGGTVLSRNVITSSNGDLPLDLSGDAVVYSAINKSEWDGKLSLDGGVMTGKLVAISPSPAGAGINIGQGGDPDTPVGGDLWVANNTLKFRAAGTYTVAARNMVQTFTSRQTFNSGAVMADTVPIGLTGYGAVQVGTAADVNLVFDGTGLQARNNGVAADLHLQPLGGQLLVGGNVVWNAGNFTPGNYVQTVNFTFANLGGKPTTLAGYGITDAVPSSQKGAANGVATLDGTGKVPSAQLPSYVDDVLEYANLAGFPGTGESGKIYIAIDTGWEYRWSGSAYVRIVASPGSTDAVPEGSTNLYFTNARAAAAAPVQSVAGKTGAVTLAKGDVGLGNVDNTSDANKPVSTATQTALDGKRDRNPITGVFTTTAAGYGLALSADWDMVALTAQAITLDITGTVGGTIPDGWGFVLRVKDNGIARSITYTNVRAVGVTLPTATVPGKTLYLAFIYNAADSKWDCVAAQQQA
jgi:hypothetical protein